MGLSLDGPIDFVTLFNEERFDFLLYGTQKDTGSTSYQASGDNQAGGKEIGRKPVCAFAGDY